MEHLIDPWVPGRVLGAARPQSDPPAPQAGVREDWFDGIDLPRLTDAALCAALDAGCQHADVRLTNSDTAYASARDSAPGGASEHRDRGIAVRVLARGRWGFAAADLGSLADAAALARRAAAMAEVGASWGTHHVELAPEPVHQGWWASEFQIDPLGKR